MPRLPPPRLPPVELGPAGTLELTVAAVVSVTGHTVVAIGIVEVRWNFRRFYPAGYHSSPDDYLNRVHDERSHHNQLRLSLGLQVRWS
jgi:hypothetical protein